MRSGPRQVVVLFSWGDLIDEDFLDRLGITLDAFQTTFRGSWMFGYVEALRQNEIETVLCCFSRRIRRPLRVMHPSGAALTILPAPRVLRPFRFSLRVVRRLGFGGSLLGRFVHDCAGYVSLPLFRLARELRRMDATAILCQEYDYQRFDLLTLLGRFLHLPVFATFQGGGERPLGPIEHFARPWSMRHSAGIIIGTAAERDRVRSLYGDNVRVAMIPNPVDIEAWRTPDRYASREQLGIPQHASVAMWHGRIEINAKGLDILIDAWDAVANKDRFLLLVGDGGDSATFRQLLAKRGHANIRWISSFVADAAFLRACLSAADVYVFPSRREGFPVAPIEALAASLPLVVSDASGLREIAGSGDDAAGIVVPVGSAGEIAAALEALFTDSEMRARYRERASKRARLFGSRVVGENLRRFLFPDG